MSQNKSWLATRLSGVPGPIMGMAHMLASASSISGINGFVVHLSYSMHVFEIAFFRQLFGLIFMAAMFLRGGLRPLMTRRIWLHVIRSVLNVIAMLSFFYGLTLEPLAKVISLSLTAPLFATVMAVLLLGEKMNFHRWVSLLLGLVGALIILRPGFVDVSLGSLYALGSAASWAVAMTCIKSLARTESSVAITFYAAFLQVPLAIVLALFVWQWPTVEQLGLLLIISMIGTTAQVALAQAFRDADSTVILPMDFTKLVWASLLGYVMFAEIPDPWAWVGGAVVFSGVLWVAYSEGRRRPPAADE